MCAPRRRSRWTTTRCTRPQEQYDPDGQVAAQHSRPPPTAAKQHRAGGHRLGAEQPAERRRRAPGGRRQPGNRQEETTNYEIGKTVRTLIHEQPQIAPISLAVMVDGAAKATQPPGAAHAEELARIAALVQHRHRLRREARRPGRGRQHARSPPMRRRRRRTQPALLGLQLEKSDVMRLAEIGAVRPDRAASRCCWCCARWSRALTTLGPAGAGATARRCAGGAGRRRGRDARRSAPDAPDGAGARHRRRCWRTKAWSASRKSRGRCAPPRSAASPSWWSDHPEETLTIVRGWMQPGARLRCCKIRRLPRPQRAAEGGDPDAGARRGTMRAACSR